MLGRKPARFLAPIVLVATAIGALLIVTNHVGSSSSTVTPSHALRLGPEPRGKYARASSYTVQPGDSLSSIANKTGVPIGTLEQLNQSLSSNPNNLQTGQRIRLRR